MSKKAISIFETRAKLEAKVNLLRKSRKLANEAALLEELLMDFN